MFYNQDIEGLLQQSPLGCPWQGSKDALPGWEAGKATLPWELWFPLKSWGLLLRSCTKHMQSLVQTALERSYVHDRGLAQTEGKDELAWSQLPLGLWTWVIPLPPGTGTSPGTQHHTVLLLRLSEKQRNRCPWQCWENLEMCTLGTRTGNTNPPVSCRVLLCCMANSAAEGKTRVGRGKKQ